MKRIFLLLVLLVLLVNMNLCLATEKLTPLEICLNKDNSGADYKIRECQGDEIERIKNKIKNKIKLAIEGYNNFNKGAPIKSLNEDFYNNQVKFENSRCGIYWMHDGSMYRIIGLDCTIHELNVLDKFISKYVEDMNSEKSNNM